MLVAFDLLYLNGRDLRKLPLLQRKAELKKIIAGTDVQFSESFEIEGQEMFAHACKVGLEGVVSKVRDSVYASGRGNNWVKKTCAQRETLTIAGFALDEGKWDGIYLGRRKGDDLVYAGKVDHGFDKAIAADLQKRLKPLIRKTQPYAKRIAHKGVWVEPKLLAEIEYRAKSAGGKGPAPVLQGTARGSLTWLVDLSRSARRGGDRTIGAGRRLQIMSDAFDYFRAYAVRALCKARSMPRGRMKHLQLVAGRIYNLLKKEAAYSPNTQHLEDFRAAQKLEASLDRRRDDGPPAKDALSEAGRATGGSLSASLDVRTVASLLREYAQRTALRGGNPTGRKPILGPPTAWRPLPSLWMC